jgi:putative heme degradation protein
MKHLHLTVGLDPHALALLTRIAEGIERMANSFDDLVAQVHANEATEASAVAAIKGLIDRIATAAGNPDPAVLATEIANAKASADALAAAIAAVPAPADAGAPPADAPPADVPPAA